LTPGPLRTRDLQRGLVDVSPKVLTQTLRSMERDGLIERTVFAAVPPRVEYGLSEMGRTVFSPLRGLCLLARANSAPREVARQRFDQNARNPNATPARRHTARMGGA